MKYGRERRSQYNVGKREIISVFSLSLSLSLSLPGTKLYEHHLRSYRSRKFLRALGIHNLWKVKWRRDARPPDWKEGSL